MAKQKVSDGKMAHALELIEKDVDLTNIIDFNNAKTGGGNDGLNWLSAMVEQSVFVCKDKNFTNRAMTTHPRYAVRQFVLAKKFEKVYLLIEDVRGQNAPLMVDPVYFSMDFTHFETLYDPLTMGPLLFPGDEGYDDDSNLSPAAKEQLEAKPHPTVEKEKETPEEGKKKDE